MPAAPARLSFEQSIAVYATSLRQRTGWRRVVAAFALGFIGALALPPTGLFPLLWLVFPGLIFLLQGAPTYWSAFLTGWSFAFGYLLLGLYWVAASMLVDLHHFWWALPFGVAGLPFGFAIWHGIAAMLAWRLGLRGGRRGIGGPLLFGVMWLLAAYARGHAFGGFPWNLEGYSWAYVLPELQLTSLIGIYGLTLLTIIAACLPAALAEGKRYRNPVIVSLLLLVASGVWGGVRLAGGTHDTVPDMHLRIVQPNIAQAMKWDQNQRTVNFTQLLDLTARPSDQSLAAVIWPETASPFYLEEDANARKAIADVLPEAGVLITGGLRRSMDGEGHPHYTNSMLAIDRDDDGEGQVAATYDKHHLVPFGEFMPLRKYSPLGAVAGMGIDFDEGAGPTTLRVADLPPFSPLICYEAIFPAETTNPDDRPDWLINITNDGWYGRLAGPYQHFQIARVRAIEQGLPLARAANTGISGVVDAYGRVTAKLGLSQTGVVDADLPVALPATVFSQVGETPLWTLIVAFAALAAWLIFAQNRARK